MYMQRLETGRAEDLTALRSEELGAHYDVAVARTVALAVIAVLVTFMSPWPAPVFTWGLLAIFVLLGWASWWVAQSARGRPWHLYAFVFADFALLTFTLLHPNPLVPFDYPPQFALRYGAFVYFFVLLAGLAYVYQPRLVLWGGVSVAVTWTIGVAWIMSLPGSTWATPDELSVEAYLDLVVLPGFIDIDVRIQEIAVFMISAGMLALAVRRARRIALRQARLAREKENLGRYFPRKTAALLATRADPFAAPAEHEAAVLFADLVAFTTWSERRSPLETITLLREVHGMLAEVVFRHDGTLDKFMGDGLMATFGTPDPSPQDAANALAAMVEMHDRFDRWRAARPDGTGRHLALAIGAHYGPVVIGNVGSAERLEFAVLGDTVNVASRLEAATRQVGCAGLVSARLFDAAGDTSGRFMPQGAIPLRGRDAEIEVYRL